MSVRSLGTFAAIFIISLSLSTRAWSESMEERGWQKISVAEIQDNPVTLFGKDWLAVAVGDREEANAMTIGWGGLGTLWGLDNAVATMYIERSRRTHELLDTHELYTMTAFSEEHRDALVYLGSTSGRNEDKMAGSGLTVGFTESGTPFFEEGRLVLECRRIYAAPFNIEGMGEKGLKNYDGGKRIFTIFIGDVVNVWVK